MTDVVDFLADQAADSDVGWSLGTFGAIAEFTRDAGAAPHDRFARTIVRVALRQMQASDRSSEALTAWLSAYDRVEPQEVEDPVHH